MELNFFLGLTQDFIAKKEHSNCLGEFCICLFVCCFVFSLFMKKRLPNRETAFPIESHLLD